MSTTETTSNARPAPTPTVEPVGHPTEEDEEELTKDAIFHILQTRRRRDALRYLKAHDGPVRMRDLAEQVAAWENATTVEALTSEERQRVYISLYQSHLPKLDDEGVIEYNQSRGIVERTEVADLLDPYLNDVEEREPAVPPATRYYYGAGILGALVLAGALWGIYGPTTVILGAIILVTFVGITVANHLV